MWKVLSSQHEWLQMQISDIMLIGSAYVQCHVGPQHMNSHTYANLKYEEMINFHVHVGCVYLYNFLQAVL